MPIDPRIPASVQPPNVPGPLAMAALFQQQRSFAAEQADREARAQDRAAEAQYREAQLGELTRKQQRQAATDRLYAEGLKVDPATGDVTLDPAVLTSGLHGASGADLPALVQTFQELQDNINKNRRSRLETQQALQAQRVLAARAVRQSGDNPTMFALQLRGLKDAGAIDQGTHDEWSAIEDPAEITRIVDAVLASSPEKGVKLGKDEVLAGETTGRVIARGPAGPKRLETKTRLIQNGAGVWAPAPVSQDLDTGKFYIGETEIPATSVREPAMKGEKVETVDAQGRKTTRFVEGRVGESYAAAPEKGATPTLEAVRGLRNDYQRETQAGRTIEAQLANMKSALESVRKGDAPAGSQGVLVTFQKILDPTSVVRESEYARSASGLSLLGQLEGWYQSKLAGGAGVTVADLEQFVRVAEQFAANQRVASGAVKEQVDALAREFKIDPALVTQEVGELPAAGVNTPPRPGAAPGRLPAVTIPPGGLDPSRAVRPGQRGKIGRFDVEVQP